jgi:serine/threonine protein kinase
VDDYRVIRELGRGSTSVVHLAEHCNGLMACVVRTPVRATPGLENEIAVARLFYNRAVSPVFRAYRRVDTPVAPHGALLGEWCRGGTLADLLGNHVRTGQPVPERTLASWTVQLLTSLTEVCTHTRTHTHTHTHLCSHLRRRMRGVRLTRWVWRGDMRMELRGVRGMHWAVLRSGVCGDERDARVTRVHTHTCMPWVCS